MQAGGFIYITSDSDENKCKIGIVSEFDHHGVKNVFSYNCYFDLVYMVHNVRAAIYGVSKHKLAKKFNIESDFYKKEIISNFDTIIKDLTIQYTKLNPEQIEKWFINLHKIYKN